MQHNQSLQKTKYVLMVEDTASVAALYRSYLLKKKLQQGYRWRFKCTTLNVK